MPSTKSKRAEVQLFVHSICCSESSKSLICLVMPLVNPDIMVWARKTAGLTIEEAATKIQLERHKLEKIERGEDIPTPSMLRRMAEKYRRPPVTFYLEDIPRKSNYGTDFRGRAKEYTPKEEAHVSALLRYAQSSQQLIRATLELEEEAIILPFVGFLRQKWNLPKEAGSVKQRLLDMSTSQYKESVSDALGGLDLVLGDECTRDIYHAQPNKAKSFKLLRASCERSGIFVILKNDLGSYHTKMSSNLFRAFVVADEIAPLMVINSGDSEAAKSFSLLHEIVHLLLEQTGISDLELSNPIEKFCNQVAGQWLLPSESLKAVWTGDQSRLPELAGMISQLCEQWNLSHMMVATRLHQEGLILQEVYSQLMEVYKFEWERSRQHNQKKSTGKQDGGPGYFTTQRSRLGEGMLHFADRMIQSGGLTVSKAAIILGVKPWNVSKLLNPK
ncbi:MAG: ImmA/IrrE family metallo-endopeptidase [Rhodothermaceae bacterium]|nr:ImmA/IrrE family metallo-endopeptidase [Rhodothermaceae bacterium]MYC05487.1 ImmA/IrrE family metallo-endopeptidase [Rhodothermaceae bacterium]MYI17853.1 ImmA/IrrE family metallo-endopeptidase [Rhodothermaceae bacterium]